MIVGYFSVNGYAPNRALGLLGIGINFGFGPDRVDFGFMYELEACHNFVNQRADLGFSFHF